MSKEVVPALQAKLLGTALEEEIKVSCGNREKLGQS
jgi:hypothetical protein